MAGAGYKLFNTGDVLTAAQVNTYLMEQSVMVFANAAARTTALSGVVAEGMLSYLKDTDAVEVYNGSAWVASDDPNAIQNTIVDAKGDLIAASANDTPARLAVGNNGETLVADSAASTGLRWQGNYAAGKNKIINGDFGIWQRGTSFTPSAGADTYSADRFLTILGTAGAATLSQQTFTAGTAPVAGYEGRFFLRLAQGTGSSSATTFRQRIEDVRTFAGQTVTVSFWAKLASAGSPLDEIFLAQNFGSGGSAQVNTQLVSNPSMTTDWVRYSYTVSVPSISGKTIGTNNTLDLVFKFDTATTYTFDIWGVQAEAGSVATAFQTATGTLAGELAACQRYYQRFGTGIANGRTGFVMAATNTTTVYSTRPLPVQMRVITSIEASNLAFTDGTNANVAITGATINNADVNSPNIKFDAASGLTQYRSYEVINNNNAAGYLGLIGEL